MNRVTPVYAWRQRDALQQPLRDVRKDYRQQGDVARKLRVRQKERLAHLLKKHVAAKKRQVHNVLGSVRRPFPLRKHKRQREQLVKLQVRQQVLPFKRLCKPLLQLRHKLQRLPKA